MCIDHKFSADRLKHDKPLLHWEIARYPLLAAVTAIYVPFPRSHAASFLVEIGSYTKSKTALVHRWRTIRLRHASRYLFAFRFNAWNVRINISVQHYKTFTQIRSTIQIHDRNDYDVKQNYKFVFTFCLRFVIFSNCRWIYNLMYFVLKIIFFFVNIH